MDPRRVGPALATAGGVAVVASTFLNWYAGGRLEGAYFNRTTGAPAYAGVFGAGGHRTAWQAFAGLDIALAAFGMAAAALGVAVATSRATQLVLRSRALASVGGVVVAAWVLDRSIDRPRLTGLDVGAVVGFSAVVVTVGGLWLSREPREPVRSGSEDG